MKKTFKVQLFAALAGMAWVSGCGGGDATLTITGPAPTQPIAQVHGTVNMPNGQVAVGPGSPLQRFAAILLPEAEALTGNASPVGAGNAVSLVLAHSDGSSDSPVSTSPTNAQGQFAMQLPAQSGPDTCRYLVSVGSGASLTRAFVTSTSIPITIDSSSEAAVRLVFNQVAEGLSLCHFTSSELNSLVIQIRSLPGDVSAATAAQANDEAYSIAASQEPPLLPPVPDTPTPRPTRTPVGPANTPTNTLPPTNSPTAQPTSTRTNTSPPTLTFTPALTFTPTNTLAPTLTFTPSVPPTLTFTATPDYTRTETPSPTITPTCTLTPSLTVTPTLTFTPTPSFTQTPVFTSTITPTLTFTATRTFTLSPTPTNTFCESCPTDTPTPTFTETPIPTDTATPTNTATPTVTPTITDTPSGPQATPTFIPRTCDLGGNTGAVLSAGIISLGLPLNGTQTWRFGPIQPDSSRQILILPTESHFDCAGTTFAGQNVKICARLDATPYCQGGANNGLACPPADCGGNPCAPSPGQGIVDCSATGGIITAYDSFVQIDHNTNKAVVGGKPNAGFPIDPTCVATFDGPDGKTLQSCLEPADTFGPTVTTGPLTPTPTPRSTPTARAPGAEVCSGDMHLPAHNNSCNSPTLQSFSGSSVPGGFKLHEAIDLSFAIGSKCTDLSCSCDTSAANTNGNTCVTNADCGNGTCDVCPPDTCPLQDGELSIAGDITSGLAKGVIWNLNNTALIMGTTGAGNGANNCGGACKTVINGQPINLSTTGGTCHDDFPASLSGATLGLAYPALDFPTVGDFIATLTLQCE